MAVPLPKKVTDLLGRQLYWQENADDEPVVATVVDARWTGSTVRLPKSGREWPTIEFQLDVGEHELKWSMPYPAPLDEKE